MKKLHLALYFSLVAMAASSQKVYFFYIQTETDQPFYVKMDKKIQYSSPGGYIILPKLYDSSYKLAIGFPQSKWPEQNFAVNVNKKDHGFVLRNVPEKGWGLYDLQSLEFMMALGEEKKQENGNVTAFTEILSKAADDPSLKEKTVQVKPEEKKPEPVVVQETVKAEPAPAQNSETVADNSDKSSKKNKRKNRKDNEAETETKPEQTIAAVTDPVKEEPKAEIKEEIKTPVKEEVKTPAKEEVKTETIPEKKPEVKTETVPGKKEEVKTETLPEKKEEVKAEVVPEKKEETKPVSEPVNKPVTEQPAKESELDNYKKSQVKRYAESSTKEGFGLVFVDQYENGSKDTIRLVIPNPKPVINKVPETPKEEKKFLDITAAPAEKTVTEEPKREEEKVQKEEKKEEEKEKNKKKAEPVSAAADLPNGCAAVASDNDVSKLNRKMKTVNDNEEKMIAEARKYFKSACFSTAQVKELSSLFINDEARYNFFDLAYKYVTDPGNFGSLQSEIKDLYYQSRFKAMLRN